MMLQAFLRKAVALILVVSLVLGMQPIPANAEDSDFLWILFLEWLMEYYGYEYLDDAYDAYFDQFLEWYFSGDDAWANDDWYNGYDDTGNTANSYYDYPVYLDDATGFLYGLFDDGSVYIMGHQEFTADSIGIARDLQIPSHIDGMPVSVIAEGAFANVQNIRNVQLPEGLEQIDVSAFEKSSLLNIALPQSLTHIEYNAFLECVNLQSISFPNKLEFIGSEAFEGCTSLKSVAIPDSVAEIYYDAFFLCDKLESVSIGSGLTIMEGNIFSGCPSLWKITVSPSNRTFYVENGVLYNRAKRSIVCYPPSLYQETFEIPNGIVEIENSCFYDDNTLKTLRLPDSLTVINDCALMGCWQLTAVNFPESISKIGEYIFYEPDTALTIYGKKGSYAETWANAQRIAFASQAMETPQQENITLILTASTDIAAVGDDVEFTVESNLLKGNITLYADNQYEIGSIDLSKGNTVTRAFSQSGDRKIQAVIDGIWSDALVIKIHEHQWDRDLYRDLLYGPSIQSNHPHEEVTSTCIICRQTRIEQPMYSSCELCFPDFYTRERALEMAQLNIDCYDIGTENEKPDYMTGVNVLKFVERTEKDKTDHLKYDKTLQTEFLLTVDRTAEGDLILNIVFQGSQDLEDWLGDIVKGAAGKNGIHFEFKRFVDRFIKKAVKGIIEPEEAKKGVSNEVVLDLGSSGQVPPPGVYSVDFLLDWIANHPNAHLRITGHSMGGSLAQIFTYYAVSQFNIKPEQIQTYTFAALPPFTHSFIQSHQSELRGANMYNYIHLADFAPNVGVTNNGYRQLYEEALELKQRHEEAAQISGKSNGAVTLGDAIYILSLDYAAKTVGGAISTAQTIMNFLGAGKGGSTFTGSNLGINLYLYSEIIGGGSHEMKNYYNWVDEQSSPYTQYDPFVQHYVGPEWDAYEKYLKGIYEDIEKKLSALITSCVDPELIKAYQKLSQDCDRFFSSVADFDVVDFLARGYDSTVYVIQEIDAFFDRVYLDWRYLNEVKRIEDEYGELSKPGINDKYAIAVKIGSNWYSYSDLKEYDRDTLISLEQKWDQIAQSIQSTMPTVKEVKLFYRNDIVGWDGGTSFAGDRIVNNDMILISATDVFDIHLFIQQRIDQYNVIFGESGGGFR